MIVEPVALQHGINRARDLLGVDPMWIIRFSLIPHPGSDDVDWRGSCEADTCSMSAFIEFRDDLTVEQARESTLHETMHVAHADIDHYLGLILPETLHAEYQRLYEQFVTRLCRALVRHLEVNGETETIDN